MSASGTRRGKTVADLVYQGMRVLQSFPTENFSRARDFSKEEIFPLPSPEEVSSFECEINKLWAEGIARCLNWMNVGNFELGKGKPSREQRMLLEGIVRELPLHIARSLRWENISESLPREGVAGILNAS